MLFGEGSLRRALTEFPEHYHTERNHPGKGTLYYPRQETLRGTFRTDSSAQINNSLEHQPRAELYIARQVRLIGDLPES